MEKIKFSGLNFVNQFIQVNNNQAIIIGDNGSGKTSILNLLEQGFKGKNNHFLVDDQPVDFDTYQVIYLKEFFNFKDNLKLTKTAPLRNSLIQKVNNSLFKNNEYQKLLTNLEIVHQEFFKLIEATYFKKLNQANFGHLTLKPTLDPFTVNNLIDKMLKIQVYDNIIENIIDEEEYSHFFLRVLLFNVLENILNDEDKLRDKVILFDLPELYGTPKMFFQINKYLRSMIKNNQTTIIIATNSSEYLKILKPELLAINLISAGNILFIKNYHKIISEAIISFAFCESDSLDLSIYKSNLLPLIEASDLENEIAYVNYNLYNKIIDSFFAEKVELYLNRDITESSIDDSVYTVKHCLEFKDLIFIYNIIFSGFQINCIWKNYHEITNFIKLLPYFDFN